MKGRLSLSAALCLLMGAGAALAQEAKGDCPPPPDHGAELQELFDEVQDAPDAATAQRISNQMWELWADAPNAAAQEILDSGMRKRASQNFLGALEEFDRLVAYCPDYAEGYNQRAFIHFILQDYDAALVDLNRTLDLSPDHVAARAGKALTLFGLDRVAEGREVLEAALELNPWLPERHLLDSALGEEL
ncbi:MAG: tetratricopeptide repeat protein [Sediminimonas sp.]|uniref:tetratricopeptide repeat protein n=1 Tax=Sediminimonas sp. TaxID=2823379 RepID=UPI00287024AF|nr:tetratricopeptide repeat protein [Sediminimonas sp.]MDR9484895.1 tetratricopeptide repeat protein [Sediminimonas sp.]